MSAQSSSQSIGALLSQRGDRSSRPGNSFLIWLERYTPHQGWATLLILWLAMLVVADTVNVAQWVKWDGLTAVMLWSSIVGLALAKVRPRWYSDWYVTIPAGLLIGGLFVVWQAARVVEADNVFGRISELFARLDTWWEAATGGGISTDLLPFFLMLLAVGWCVGFFASWFVFRHSNVWVAVVLLGTASLTSLSFLPDRFGARFFVFVILAMVLVVRLDIVRRHTVWKRLGIQFESITGWLTLHAAFWFSLAVLILALILPMNVYTNVTAAQMWNTGRAPVTKAEDFFARLFAALPSKKDQHGRLFDKWLPFIGKISFGGDPVAWATTQYPSYWLSQTYNYYTPRGWVATETEDIDVGPNLLPPPLSDNLEREPKPQIMQLGFESDKFLSGGGFDSVSRPAIIESLGPRKFVIDMNDSTNDAEMPTDVQELAARIRADARGLSENMGESIISDLLPSDMLILESSVDSRESLDIVILQRKAPATPDIVSWRFTERVQKNEPYRMISYVSTAADDDLRQAPTDYGSFVTDHYLQLPSSLPSRVRELAADLTENADNPLDKALAIQSYLRGPEFEYSQDIEPPPSDADGVDWFLFESKKGYSDYFGSSMAVMLRSAGVPARMAAGYAPGVLNEDGQRVIRDSDSHGWVQAYFPGYGWIDFEPTPNWPTHDRDPIALRPSGSGSGVIDQDPESGLTGLDIDPEDDGSPFFGVPVGSFERGIDFTRYSIFAAIAIAVVAGLWLLWSFVWNFGLESLGPESRAYAKMSRLGWLAGIGRRAHQTPIEYAAAIGRSVPDAASGASHIASAYSYIRYRDASLDGDDADDESKDELTAAWKGIRYMLIGKMFRRIIPETPARRS